MQLGTEEAQYSDVLLRIDGVGELIRSHSRTPQRSNRAHHETMSIAADLIQYCVMTRTSCGFGLLHSISNYSNAKRIGMHIQIGEIALFGSFWQTQREGPHPTTHGLGANRTLSQQVLSSVYRQHSEPEIFYESTACRPQSIC